MDLMGSGGQVTNPESRLGAFARQMSARTVRRRFAAALNLNSETLAVATLETLPVVDHRQERLLWCDKRRP
ncbi:hypothetical protein TNCV_4843061 [Trichonephila clavipes]|uniref:Uncharacterized protein n=1 Tax=Trichonephila clavipes TaxID=2585209 RepID=A0A8X6WJ39_TRICX|nr:hypothetical protein TNCV_4843061 [Trichonephila clavipes]